MLFSIDQGFITYGNSGPLWPTVTHCVFNFLRRIIELNGGQSPLTYKRFQTLISRMDPVEGPVETITAETMGKCTTPLSEDHDDKFGVPSLEELGE